MKRPISVISFVMITACTLPVTLHAAEAKEAEVKPAEVKEAEVKPDESKKEESPAKAASLWQTDFQKAKALSKKSGRPILALFTGSDWCSWCVALHNEVLSKSEFVKYAGESLVLFEADFPRTKKLSDEVTKQNQTLATKYSVRGFPTVLILDAEGGKLGETGYKEGGAEVYVEHLKSLIKKSEK